MADYADPRENERIQREEASRPAWYTPTVRAQSYEERRPQMAEPAHPLGNPIAAAQFAQYQAQIPLQPVEEPDLNLPRPTFFDDQEEENNSVVRPPISGIVEVLDERGDLILVVGPERREFLVCSRTLLRASKTFEVLFNRRYEGADGHMRLDIKEIGVVPLHLVLQVIHGNPTKVDEFIDDPNTLHDVLVVTHHFKMTQCLAPIAGKWLRKTYSPEPAGFHNIAVQLWITHQLGHLGCLRQTICCMVVRGRLNSKGDLIGQGASDNDAYSQFPTLKLLKIVGKALFLPTICKACPTNNPCPQDHVKHCRSHVVATLVNMVRDAITNLTQSPRQPVPSQSNGPTPKPTVCRAKNESPVRRRQCDCRMLGAFMRALYDQNWDKVDHPSSSPYSLHRRISEISRQTLKEYELPSELHRNCGPFGDKEVQPLMPIVTHEVDQIPFDEADFVKRGTMMGFGKPR